MTSAPRDYSWLPKIYREIAAVAGLDVALAIGRAKGGTRVRFASKASEDHWLRQLVGPEAAALVAELYPAEWVILPLSPADGLKGRRRRAEQALDSGATADEAALIAGRHVRSIYRYRARRRENEAADEQDLFGGIGGKS